MNVERLADLDFEALTRGGFHPSPSAWEDEVLYFLLLDRFSDGREDGYRDANGNVVRGATPLYQTTDNGNAITTEADAARWRAAGGSWCGGTLAGVRSKLGYLKRLGVTTLWISPVLKQSGSPTGGNNYHGYSTQNFLAVDPHFGTAQDLRDLVVDAHAQGLRIILDIVLNHVGDVFAYDPDRYLTTDPETGRQYLDPRWDGNPYRVAGWRDAAGNPTLPFPAPTGRAGWPDGAVWPAELQRDGVFTCRGRISDWNNRLEYLQGDFFDLKDVWQGAGSTIDDYVPSAALSAITQAYKWWLAYADLDGFRVDTVKHMDPGATRYFASVIHEFAQSIGKDNFYCISENTQPRAEAISLMEITGLDATLGLDDLQPKLIGTVKGTNAPADYFDLFRNSEEVGQGSHTFFRDRVVTSYDDHDMVWRGRDDKARFCAAFDASGLALAALALNATTVGIPCIYYGSEQLLDGAGGNDRYIREAMFGGAFGPFRSCGRHCFDENAATYVELAKVLGLRRQQPALRRGRQYLRPISEDGQTFGLPTRMDGPIRSLVAWSRILANQELLCAINTDPARPTTAWVTIDAGLHTSGDELTCLYSIDGAGIGARVNVTAANGNAVQLMLPPGGFVVYR